MTTTRSIFLTGGSGYIGSALIAAAIARDYTITALSRSPTSDAHLLALGATPIRGDLSSLATLTREAAKADIVISLADALASDFSIAKEERARINGAANDALAEGLRGTGKALVLTGGSLYAAASPNGEETDERSPPWPKAHWAAFELGRGRVEYSEMGIRCCQVRLAPWVYGRGGSGVGLFMGMWAKAGFGVKVDVGEKYTTTVHVDDAVDLYLRVAEQGRAGEAFNATAQTDVTLGQLAEAICSAIHVPCQSVSYQEAVPKLGPFLAGFLSVENRASNLKAREELGWEVTRKGILEEIETGSYVEIARALRDGRGA